MILPLRARCGKNRLRNLKLKSCPCNHPDNWIRYPRSYAEETIKSHLVLASAQNHLVQAILVDNSLPTEQAVDRPICGLTKLRALNGEVLGLSQISASPNHNLIWRPADLTFSGFVSYKEDIAPSTETLRPNQQVWTSRYAIRPEFRRRGSMKGALETLLFG